MNMGAYKINQYACINRIIFQRVKNNQYQESEESFK